jgi:hypothetical protein
MTELLSLNKTYTKTAPNDGLRTDPDGILLTNGAIGDSDFEDATKWVGWQNTNVTIRIDLAIAPYLASVRFHFLANNGEDIYAPSQVVVSGSNDDSSYTTLGTFVKITDWSNTDGFINWSNSLAISGLYRYVKFVFTYQVKRLLISEIEIYGTPAWTTPVTDRTALDITNRTAKAFLNVADWIRIRDNAALLASILGVSLDTVATPTTTTFPSVTELNYLCHNIERLRAALPLPSLTPIKYTWLEGNKVAPKYTDVNQWELTLLTIEQYFERRKPRTGIAGAGRGLTRNNGFRS